MDKDLGADPAFVSSATLPPSSPQAVSTEGFNRGEVGWTKPSKAMPPLHTQVLVALKGSAGGEGETIDVACYIGKMDYGDGVVDQWIGTGNRFETRQLAGWMTVHTMREVNQMAKQIAFLEETLANERLMKSMDC